jgi:hypothetical protein
MLSTTGHGADAAGRVRAVDGAVVGLGRGVEAVGGRASARAPPGPLLAPSLPLAG